MAFNLPEYYTRGAGKLFIADRDLATGGAAATGLEFLGDASEYTLDPSQEFVEHMEHQSGDGKKDVRIPRATTMTGNLILDNTAAANLKRFMRGKLTSVAGATITAEAHVAPAAGQSFLLDHPVATFTSLTDDAATPVPYTAGTDYVRDGRVIYIPTGSTAASADVEANYVSASRKVVDLFGETFKEFYVYFDGFNTINRKGFSLELFKVSFDPAALGNLLGDEIVTLTIAFEALFEPLKATSNLGGFGEYITVD
jgi:hypothetical protein